GDACATNQVLYNLRRRGIEAGLLPWCGERDVPIQAYSPIEQGRLLRDRVLTEVAIRHRATTAQIALAWVLRQPDMVVIPKAATLEHVRENRAALDIELTAQDLAELDRAFPPPAGPRPLELLSSATPPHALRAAPFSPPPLSGGRAETSVLSERPRHT